MEGRTPHATPLHPLGNPRPAAPAPLVVPRFPPSPRSPYREPPGYTIGVTSNRCPQGPTVGLTGSADLRIRACSKAIPCSETTPAKTECLTERTRSNTQPRAKQMAAQQRGAPDAKSRIEPDSSCHSAQQPGTHRYSGDPSQVSTSRTRTRGDTAITHSAAIGETASGSDPSLTCALAELAPRKLEYGRSVLYALA